MLAAVLYLAAACQAWPSYGGLRDPGHCNPLVKDSNCPPDSAFAGKTSLNFDGASYNKDFENFWAVDDQTSNDRDRLKFSGDSKSLEVSMTDQNQAPTLTSHQYLLFGKVTVKVKAAKGAGLVTTFVLKSDSGDEIDWEMLGAFQNQAQSNYYYNGQPLFNTYNTTYALSSSSYDDLHTYTVEWTDQFLKFSIGGAELRTWHLGEIPAEKWPQTPMQVKLGIWAVEPYDDPGEIAWAGGVADWSRKPFTAAFQSVEIEDYTGWCEEVESGGPVQYQYGEGMKGWADVRVNGCRKRRAPGTVGPPPTGTSSSASSPVASSTSTDGAEPTDREGDGKDGSNRGHENASAALANPSVAAVLMTGLAWILFF